MGEWETWDLCSDDPFPPGPAQGSDTTQTPWLIEPESVDKTLWSKSLEGKNNSRFLALTRNFSDTSCQVASGNVHPLVPTAQEAEADGVGGKGHLWFWTH